MIAAALTGTFIFLPSGRARANAFDLRYAGDVVAKGGTMGALPEGPSQVALDTFYAALLTHSDPNAIASLWLENAG